MLNAILKPIMNPRIIVILIIIMLVATSVLFFIPRAIAVNEGTYTLKTNGTAWLGWIGPAEWGWGISEFEYRVEREEFWDLSLLEFSPLVLWWVTGEMHIELHLYNHEGTEHWDGSMALGVYSEIGGVKDWNIELTGIPGSENPYRLEMELYEKEGFWDPEVLRATKTITGIYIGD